MQKLLIYYALECFSAIKKDTYLIILQPVRLEEEMAKEVLAVVVVVEAHVLALK
jgi:hypothetical protein